MAYLRPLVPNVQALARSMGCNRTYLSLVLHGIKTPSPRFAIRLEKATGGMVRAAWLLGLEDPPAELPKAS